MAQDHHHGPDCYDVRRTCDQAQHQHVRTCYVSDDPGDRDARSRVVCPRTEHEHTDRCDANVRVCGYS